MPKSRSAQYFFAGALGAMFLFAQLVAFKAQLGEGFQIDRHSHMFWQVVAVILDDIQLTAQVATYIAFALLAHIGLSLVALFSYRTAFSRFVPGKAEKYGLLFVVLVLLLMAMWNRLLHPVSRAFEQVEPLMLQPLSPILMGGGAALVIAVVLATLIKGAIRFWKSAVVGTLLLAGIALPPILEGPRQKREHPDIIILGIDSLRTDFTHAYGFPRNDLTPTINSLLEDMVVVEGAITPTGRTFVSYMSLLTGKNPSRHGARFNLFPWDHIQEQRSISGKLGELNYQRILAMDESRFANFPPFLGFDGFVVPRVGGLDFVIGSSYDLAATNLILSVPYIGPRLDYVFGNRAAYRTYLPDHHVSKVLKELRPAPADQPLFLISHLCLPHWPYLPGSLWIEDNFHEYRALEGFEDVPTSYFRSLAAADGQVSSILQQLRKSGRLENALVIVISDHGESFGLRRDMLDDLDTGLPRLTFGHGGFVMAIEQNSIVMGMQHYKDGVRQWAPKKIRADVSIIDLAPTIEDVAFGETNGYEGASLIGLVSTGENRFQGRPRFLESGIRSSGVERPDVDEREVAAEMSFLYRVTPDLRFEVRPELIPGQLDIKQRAVILDGKIVGAIPSAFEGNFGDCWGELDIATGQIKCVEFPSSDPLTRKLQNLVCEYYRDDPGFAEAWCHTNHVAGE